MKKNYVVLISQEEYKKNSDKKYHYISLNEKGKPIFFETLEEAKEYINNYKLENIFENNNHYLYLDYVEIRAYNDNDELEEYEKIGEDCIEDKAFDLNELEEKLSIQFEN